MKLRAIVVSVALLGASFTLAGARPLAPTCPTLAQVLAQGNDTGGAEIVNVTSGTANADMSGAAIATGTGNANADHSSDTQSGISSASNTASTNTGTAYAQLTAISAAGAASIGAVADSSGAYIKVDGLPTSDPHVAGVLWNDNGTLKISAG